MAVPVRYRLLGQLSLSFKTNGLLTGPVVDLWTSFLGGERTQPNLKESRASSNRFTIQQRIAALKKTFTPAGEVSCSPHSSVTATHDLNSTKEVKLHQTADSISNPHDDKQNPNPKLSQLSKDIEFEVELLFLALQERISEVKV
jgi:hypothetical protein